VDLSSQGEDWLEVSPRTNKFRRFLRVFLGRKVVIIGVIIIIVLIFVAAFASQIAPYDPYEMNLRATLQPPSPKHLVGTDPLGRDVLSRIIFGTRVSLAVGIVSVSIGAFWGMMLGLIAGYFGGIINTLIMRMMDAMMAIPPIMLALAIAATLGGGLANVMVSLGVALVPTYARLMCGQVLTVKHSDYVTAGEVIGGSDLRIMLVHIFPNCLPPLIVLVTLNLGYAILIESALSFLGIGVRPPMAAWGAMVSYGYRYLLSNPLLSFVPGLCIMLVVLAFNMVGDGLRDALDPRLRGSL
jgi:peptide/nickel transport system permease protein